MGLTTSQIVAAAALLRDSATNQPFVEVPVRPDVYLDPIWPTFRQWIEDLRWPRQYCDRCHRRLRGRRLRCRCGAPAPLLKPSFKRGRA
jgi:hypothetical protein